MSKTATQVDALNVIFLKKSILQKKKLSNMNIIKVKLSGQLSST